MSYDAFLTNPKAKRLLGYPTEAQPADTKGTQAKAPTGPTKAQAKPAKKAGA